MVNKIRAILDTNIYGEMVLEKDTLKIIEKIRKSNIKIYGFETIRKELRDTPKEVKIEGKNLRISLLELYEQITKDSYKYA